ncbi:MAG TPA: RimK family alpha-L-glutamate ligase [Pirellulaceae bacterium]|nr:RimK family alpha-L-glutamate ligase [Pirellulaceae bacterium]
MTMIGTDLMRTATIRLAILGSPTGVYSRQLLDAALKHLRVEPSLHEFDGLGSSIGPNGWRCTTAEGTELTACDAVIVRTMPLGTLEQVVFRIDLLHRLQAAGVRVINSPRSLEIAIDKYLTTAMLAAAGLPVPETIAVQSVDEAMAGFDRLGQDVVVKPLFGGEGRGLIRLEDPDLAVRAFRTLVQLGAVIYLQRFVRHPGYDVRILLIGDQAWSIRRIHPTDWRTNVSRGARAERFEPPAEWIELARRAASAIDARIVGIDLLPDERGEPLVLEANAVPGWQGLAAAHGIDVAGRVIARVVDEVDHDAAG